jgi:hypothetical protein
MDRKVEAIAPHGALRHLDLGDAASTPFSKPEWDYLLSTARTLEHLSIAEYYFDKTSFAQRAFLAEFQNFLIELKTKPAIIDSMIQGVQIWMFEENDLDHGASQREMQRFVDSPQTTIGWKLFMRGILASDWSERQQEYLINVNGTVRGAEADKWSSRVS